MTIFLSTDAVEKPPQVKVKIHEASKRCSVAMRTRFPRIRLGLLIIVVIFHV